MHWQEPNKISEGLDLYEQQTEVARPVEFQDALSGLLERIAELPGTVDSRALGELDAMLGPLATGLDLQRLPLRTVVAWLTHLHLQRARWMPPDFAEQVALSIDALPETITLDGPIAPLLENMQFVSLRDRLGQIAGSGMGGIFEALVLPLLASNDFIGPHTSLKLSILQFWQVELDRVRPPAPTPGIEQLAQAGPHRVALALQRCDDATFTRLVADLEARRPELFDNALLHDLALFRLRSTGRLADLEPEPLRMPGRGLRLLVAAAIVALLLHGGYRVFDVVHQSDRVRSAWVPLAPSGQTADAEGASTTSADDAEPHDRPFRRGG